MRQVTDSARLRYTGFVFSALMINVVDGTLVRTASDPQRRLILAIASSFDLIVVVVALYYWLLVRAGIRTRLSMIMLTVLATVRASFLFPIGRGKTIVAALCEVSFVAIAMIYIQRARKMNRGTGADPVEVIRTAVRTILPVPLAVNALTCELAIIYYALFSWRVNPHVPTHAKAFTNYKKAGQAELLSLLPIACMLETIPIHLLLAWWSSAAAWTLTALNVYAVI